MSAGDESSCEMYALNYSKPGSVIIFNYSEFEARPELRLERSEQDIQEIRELFQKEFKFTVKCHLNETAAVTKMLLNRYAKQEHDGDVCLICFIMSRSQDGKILASDNSAVELNDFINSYKTNETLAKKPKLFFVLTCQSLEKMSSYLTEDANASLRISVHDDDLLCYHVTGPESSFYSQQGSFVIQAICQAIRSSPANELSQILRSVSNSIEQRGFQMPKVEKTLSKMFHFTVNENIVRKLIFNAELEF